MAANSTSVERPRREGGGPEPTKRDFKAKTVIHIR